MYIIESNHSVPDNMVCCSQELYDELAKVCINNVQDSIIYIRSYKASFNSVCQVGWRRWTDIKQIEKFWEMLITDLSWKIIIDDHICFRFFGWWHAIKCLWACDTDKNKRWRL